MKTQNTFCAGDWVEVRSKEEILRTLDKSGQLESLPFMPQMFQYCGKRFKVFKRAHKTCDTVNEPVGRRMANAVHLDGLRCDGKAYGGCQALCLLFWKEAWLKSVSKPPETPAQFFTGSNCTESDVMESAKACNDDGELTYICQATQLPKATSRLKRWDLSQYCEDYVSGNVGLSRLVCGFLYASVYGLIQAGVGLGGPLRWVYDRFQAAIGGIPFPKKRGIIPKDVPTPAGALNLQPGEMVRVKPYDQILATLNTDNKNRGLYFDAEMVPFCGGTYRVLQRVQRIVDEKTGKLMNMKNESIILEGAFCRARYSRCRLFCPRSIYPYWREIWLERVSLSPELESAVTPG